MFKVGKEGTWDEKNDSSGNKEGRVNFDQKGAHSGLFTVRLLTGFHL